MLLIPLLKDFNVLLIRFFIFPLQKFLRLDYVYDGESADGQLLADFTNSCFDEKEDSKATDIDVTSMTGALTVHFKTGEMGVCRGFNIFTSCTDVAGANEITAKEGIRLYPNPVDGLLYIEGEDLGEINIYDITGRKAGTATR